jgi:1-acyl-sn-glycerol-3-phosphate acyltransferase
MNPLLKVLVFARSIFAIFVIFPIWTVFLIFLNIVNSLTIHNRAINDWIISRWCRGNCWMFGVKVRVHGFENLPVGTCLILFNHTSFFDIFAIQAQVPSVRFGAKIELFKIPLFGPAMKRVGVLPIARGNLEEVLRVYKAAEPRAAAGEKFALAPEGGRNTSAKSLMNFKAGPFLFAVSAKTPIVPVVVKGAREVWPVGRLIPQTLGLRAFVDIHFLPVVSVEGVLPAEKAKLQVQTYQEMSQKMAEIGY